MLMFFTMNPAEAARFAFLVQGIRLLEALEVVSTSMFFLSLNQASVTSWRSSVAPPGHCVPGIPDPRPLPPYSYLYTGSSGTTTWQVPLAAVSPWSPTALLVPVTVSRLYRYRYGYAAGPLGVQRTPGSCSLPLVPVPLPWFYRYGYVAGHLREQRAVEHNCH